MTGLLAFTRWGLDPPRESLRLVSLAMDALHRLGENRAVAPRDGDSRRRAEPERLGCAGYGLDFASIRSARTMWRKAAGAGRVDADAADLSCRATRPRNPFGSCCTPPIRRRFTRAIDITSTPVQRRSSVFLLYRPAARPPEFCIDHQQFERGLQDQPRRSAAVQRAGGEPIATALILLLPRACWAQRLPKQKAVIAFLWYFLCLGAGYILIQWR